MVGETPLNISRATRFALANERTKAICSTYEQTFKSHSPLPLPWRWWQDTSRRSERQLGSLGNRAPVMTCPESLASFRIRFCCGTRWGLGSICSCSTTDPPWLTTANTCGGFRRLSEIPGPLMIRCRFPAVGCRWDRGGKGGGSRLSITSFFLDEAPSSLILPSVSCFFLCP